MFALPGEKEFSQSASVGFDYKHFDQIITVAGKPEVTPITYYPVAATYGANWLRKQSTTELNAGVIFNFRGVGSNSSDFNLSRSNADGNFLIFHGDLAQTQELPAGFQLYGKVQGQIADQALLSGEQIAGGGQGTVRGYLEAEAVGDSGVFGRIELRSPTVLRQLAGKKGDWRFYAFADAGWLKVIDPLTLQKTHFDFASYGFGSRVSLFEHFDGEVTASFPKLQVGQTTAHETRVTFQAGLNY